MRTVKFEIGCIVLICTATIASCRDRGCISPIKKMVIDTDGVFDDIFAIMMALEAERIDNGPKIVAITCLSGVNTLSNGITNVLKTLRALNRTDVCQTLALHSYTERTLLRISHGTLLLFSHDSVPCEKAENSYSQIPVYAGTASPLLAPNTKDYTYGQDGFGDFYYPDAPSIDLVQETHAVNALIELAKKYKGELTVVSVAPQTNIAMAIRMFPEFHDHLQQLIVMGGSVEGRGNVRPGIDYNTYCDPIANCIVFSSATSKPVHFVYLETTVRARIPMSLRLRLNECDNEKSWLLRNGESIILNSTEKYWYCPDAIGMVVAITSGSIVTKSHPYYMDTIVEGIKTQGMTLVDYTNITGNPVNANLIQDIDVNEYKRSLLRWFGCESGGNTSR